MRRTAVTVWVLVWGLVAVVGSSPALGATDRNAVIELTFPVAGPVTYTDTYDANRDGGRRRHQATDVFGVKGQPVLASVAGTICFAPGIDEPMPSYGYMLRICRGDEVHSFIHLDNDTPGTDDGRGGHRAAYAPGIREGVAVARGQVIGYLGDSGNAEDTPPHLHYAIHDGSLVDPALTRAPWRQHQRNPYPSLVAAQRRGDVVAGAMRAGHRGPEVRAWQQDLNAAIAAGLTVDGDFGPATDSATRRFQRDRGLAVDGVVGPATRGAMADVLSDLGRRPATPAGRVGTGFPGRLLRLTDPPLRGAAVRAWPQRMRDRGWRGADGAALAVDGIFGPDSDRAARLFQQERGLGVDGVV